ncbi:AAA family ATPase [Paenibacillus sp. LHD-117]|uniref:AAA family ATPase n=1 Tax=Paenibacillus sp. LHD-117 TaxID=3071412 RepID=UPI0027E19815|nr:AAA family ATPase [Paenibacillus sp. LHD-117]MDQ6419590.1 AAA family ATPase [Paenibacillus sp. LHD-117]
MIGDLNPAGVRIQSEMNLAVLADHSEIDYAYIAPEQTGKINRTPDRRCDLYALGVMFYEMLAGSLPFQAHSKEEWVHAHLAMTTKPLRELRPETEGSLENIIMKLLSKSPEERYQSAYGLLADLKKCFSSLEQNGEIIPFEIAYTDEASQFRLPRSLFGREAESETLREAYEQTRTGASPFVFVSGKAGSGKTALIRELQTSVIRDGGQFVTGKCDLMNRDIPFEPIIQALGKLIRQMWSESSERKAKLKARLTESLGTGAGVIAQLLPEAVTLLGIFPAVEPLPPAEATIRLQRLLPIFMKCFASKAHPLVLFLDDLQWADPATLDVLRTLAHDQTLQGLFIIGASREESPPLADTPLQMRHIALEALSYIEVRQFVSHMLHENTSRVRSFAESLYHRTGGNPLYVHRLLDSLYRDNKLYFDEEQAIWTWETDAIDQLAEDPDILHLIGNRIRMLPEETIELLAIAAAIGHRFRLATIALVSGRSISETLELLQSVVEEGLLRRDNDTDEVETGGGHYTFLHDRVQQAAYQAVPELEKAAFHLRIGRAMRSDEPGELEEPEESIFDVVYHLNRGCDEITDEAEKEALAAYNLQAGLKSKASTAFAAALHFLETGLRLATDDKQGTGSVAYRIMLELPECEYMCGRVDRAEELLDQLMTRTTDTLERSRIYLIRIAMNAYSKKDDAALNIGLQALAEFGWNLPVKPSKAAMAKEVALTQFALYRTRAELPCLPVNREPVYRALSDLVMTMSASVFVSSPELAAVLYPRFIRYGLKHGNNEAFIFMLGAYGMMLDLGFPRNNAGARLTKLAYELSTSFESAVLRGRLHFVMGLSGQYRSSHEAVKHFEKSVDYGLQAGDMTFAAYSTVLRIINHTGDLYVLSAFMSDCEQSYEKVLDEVTLKLFRITRMYMRELQGESGTLDEIDVPVRGEHLNVNQKNQAFYYCTCKMETAYLAKGYRMALKWGERARFNETRQNPLLTCKQLLYQSLSLAALYWEDQTEGSKGIRAALHKQLRSMKQQSYYSSGSMLSAYMLVTAELRWIEGNRAAAAKGYEDAIQAARSEGYGLLEAIACERASMYYRETGMTTAADALMADACTAYSRWGATVKVSKLREAYPELPLFMVQVQEDGRAVTEKAGRDEAAREAMPFIVDEKALIRQISGRSSSRDNEDVMVRFLDSALHYSGAVKGYVLSSREEQFSVLARAGGREQLAEAPSYAEAIVRYVVNSSEPVVLADASDSPFAADRYIRRCKPKSVLCMPVVWPEESLPSVLYLENNLISGVFNEMKLEALELMISRMVYLKSLAESREQISVASSAPHAQPLVERLTDRETEILYALSDGLSNKEIAFRFGLTEATVKTHLSNLYGKLGVKRRLQAIAQARELRLLE